MTTTENGYDQEASQSEDSRRFAWLAWALSIALVLTTAKGLKVGGVLGPGEFVLLAYFGASLTNKRRGARWRLAGAFAVFWYIVVLALLLGYLVRTNMPGIPDPFPRTLFAYGLIVVTAIAFFRFGHLRAMPWLFGRAFTGVLTAVSFAVVLVALSGVTSVGGTSLYWQGTSRFQGWSLDPNQFTIPFVAAPFIAASLLSVGAYVRRRGLAIASIAVMLVIPWMTQSDSLVLAWACGLIYVIVRFALPKEVGDSQLRPLRVAAFGALVFGLVYFVVNRELLLDAISEFLGRDGQTEGRLAIWRESSRIISESPVVGFGPDAGRDLGGGRVGEAHNNFFFLGESAGVLGMFALFALFLFVGLRVWRSGDVFLLAAFISLVTFGLAHTTLRHPVYWFTILLIDALALATVESRARGDADGGSSRWLTRQSSSRF